MNGDDVAVWNTVHDPRTYGYAGDTDRANHGTLPIRHKHIHTGRRYGRVHVFQIHIWNFNAKETGPALALPRASHARAPSKLQPMGMSLGDVFCSARAPVQHTKARSAT